MKKLYILFLGMFIAFSVISCSNPSNSGGSGGSGGDDFFDYQDVTGWDDIDDVWENLTSSGIGSWIVGDWDYTCRSLNNYNENYILERSDLTAVAHFTGDTSSSAITFSDSSDPSYHFINNLGEFKTNMDTRYADNIWETLRSGLESEGITVTKMENKHVWRKVNEDKNKMEFYKSIKLTGTKDGETRTLIIQMNESLVKQ